VKLKMNKPMKTPHAVVSISYPIEGPVADIVSRCQMMGRRSERLRDLIVMGEQYPATVRALEADVRDADMRMKRWMGLAYKADHLAGHPLFAEGAPCATCVLHEDELDSLGEDL